MGRQRAEIEAAVWRNLTAEQRRSGLGTSALHVARLLDEGPFPAVCRTCSAGWEHQPEAMVPRDAAALTRELRATLLVLKAGAPAKQQEDSLAKRRARRAATRDATG